MDQALAAYGTKSGCAADHVSSAAVHSAARARSKICMHSRTTAEYTIPVNDWTDLARANRQHDLVEAGRRAGLVAQREERLAMAQHGERVEIAVIEPIGDGERPHREVVRPVPSPESMSTGAGICR